MKQSTESRAVPWPTWKNIQNKVAGFASRVSADVLKSYRPVHEQVFGLTGRAPRIEAYVIYLFGSASLSSVFLDELDLQHSPVTPLTKSEIKHRIQEYMQKTRPSKRHENPHQDVQSIPETGDDRSDTVSSGLSSPQSMVPPISFDNPIEPWDAASRYIAQATPDIVQSQALVPRSFRGAAVTDHPGRQTHGEFQRKIYIPEFSLHNTEPSEADIAQSLGKLQMKIQDFVAHLALPKSTLEINRFEVAEDLVRDAPDIIHYMSGHQDPHKMYQCLLGMLSTNDSLDERFPDSLFIEAFLMAFVIVHTYR